MSYQHLFVTSDYPPQRGGVARYYWNLLKEFPSESTLVLAPPSETALSDGPQNVERETFVSPGLSWPRWAPLVRAIRSRLVEQKPAFLHIGQVVPVGTAALLANRGLGIPTVVYTHGMDLLYAERRPWRRWIAGRVLRNAHTVVANSAFTASIVGRFGVRKDRIVVVRPGVSFWPPEQQTALEERLRADLGLHPGTVMLLSVGRLVARKGIAAVLDAVAALKDSCDILYCIVGDGPERPHLQRRAQTLGIEHRVRFLGAVDDTVVRACYAITDIFALATEPAEQGRDVEGFGIAYLEAGAFGKPVLATDVGGVREAVEDGVTGVLIPPRNTNALLDALRLLATEPTLRTKLGKAGRERVEREGRWSQRAAPLLQRLASRQ